MCGRIILTHKPTRLRGLEYEISFEPWGGPRFNIAPTESVATLLNDSSPSVQYTRWGLIPSWAKDMSIGNKMINARAETLAEKPSYKRLIAKQRCVILADGFYEWKSLPGSKARQPMLIRLKSKEVFALAGLWDRWVSPENTETISSTIITTEPNELMATVHNRMPVILRPDCISRWLSPDAIDMSSLLSHLIRYPDSEMEMYPVSTLVNKPGIDRSECVAPLSTQEPIL